MLSSESVSEDASIPAKSLINFGFFPFLEGIGTDLSAFDAELSSVLMVLWPELLSEGPRFSSLALSSGELQGSVVFSSEEEEGLEDSSELEEDEERLYSLVTSSSLELEDVISIPSTIFLGLSFFLVDGSL